MLMTNSIKQNTMISKFKPGDLIKAGNEPVERVIVGLENLQYRASNYDVYYIYSGRVYKISQEFIDTNYKKA